MNYLFLFFIICLSCSQNALKKKYTLSYGEVQNSQYFFLFIMSVASFIVLLIAWLFSPVVKAESIPYGIASGVFTAAVYILQLLCFKYGKLSITSLVIYFSLLIPSVYGVLVYNETLDTVSIIGICLLIICLFFINDYSKSDKKVPKKYYPILILCFICNGAYLTIQKVHSTELGKSNLTFFLLIDFLVVAIINAVAFFMLKPKNEKSIYKNASLIGGVTGVFCAGQNVLLNLLAAVMPATILYPSFSACGIIGTLLLSIFLYKEKLKLHQYIGYAFGVVSIILLNI